MLIKMRLTLFVCTVIWNSVRVKYTVNGAPFIDTYRLDVIHYNDFHDRFEETTVSYPVCESNDENCLGGFARLYYEINTLLKEKENPILLNAGDTFQGTYWYTLMKWNITQKFINLLPNDVHTVGNHEFDDGIAGLAPYLAALKAPVVVANIDTTAVPELDGLYKPHVVLEKKGRKIGVIGLTTPETKTSSNPGKVKFLDPIATVKKEAQLLTDQGIDIIIVLSHCGLEVDKKMAEVAGENIDLIVGGHSHSLLWNGEAPNKEHVSGPYPVVVKVSENPEHKHLRILINKICIKACAMARKVYQKSHIGFDIIHDDDTKAIVANIRARFTKNHQGTAISSRGLKQANDIKVLIVTASAFSKYLGNMTMFFDRSGELVSYSATPVFLNRSIPEDPEMKALLKPYTEKLHSLVKEVLGYTNEDLLAPKCGSGECAIGNFIADAFLDATKELNLSNLTHVSFILRNMIRGSLAKGDITRGSIINTMPFTNQVVTMSLPGRYLIDVFKTCMTNYWVAKPFSGPWMPHVAGLRLAIDLTNGIDIQVQVKEGEEYQDLDLDREYQVSTIGFLVRPGNQFEELSRYGRNVQVVGKDTELLENYVKKTSPVEPKLEKRLTVIN